MPARLGVFWSRMRLLGIVQGLFVVALAAYVVFTMFAYRPVPLTSRTKLSSNPSTVADVKTGQNTVQIFVEESGQLVPKQVVQHAEESKVVRTFSPFQDRCSKKRCQFGQGCAFNLLETAIYMPEPSRAQRSKRIGQYEEFKAYLCSLKVSSAAPKLDPFADRTTVGKTYRSWINLLVEFAFWPASVSETSPKRYVMNAERIANWHWLNQKSNPNDECRGSTGYLRTDVCAPEDPQPWRTFRLSKAFGKNQDGESLLFLWFLGARLVFENALTPCFHELLRNDIERSLHIYPKYEANPVFRNAIAMHIRRGDACERWSSLPGDLRKPRPCYTTELYFKAAVAMKQTYGSDQILLATEDEATISEAKELCDEHGFRLYYLKYNREPFDVKEEIKKSRDSVGNEESTPGTEEFFIEEKKMSASDQRTVTLSLFADIKLLSQANMIIGTSTSWVSRILWMVIGGTHETIPPFAFIDSPYVNRKFGSDITWESAMDDVCRACRCSR